jgi:alpha-beta hydrolase superfamily lysophospholipase
LNNIPDDMPIAILVGKQDAYCDKADVDRLARELGHRVVMHKEYDNADHSVFSIGKDMSWTNDVVELIQSIDSFLVLRK